VNCEPNRATPTGMVRRSLELLNVSAIRNSAQQAVNVKIPAVNSPGQACGRMTDQSVRAGEAPSMRALSSISCGIARK
jgi:hypothetical protein